VIELICQSSQVWKYWFLQSFPSIGYNRIYQYKYHHRKSYRQTVLCLYNRLFRRRQIVAWLETCFDQLQIVSGIASVMSHKNVAKVVMTLVSVLRCQSPVLIQISVKYVDLTSTDLLRYTIYNVSNHFKHPKSK